MLRCGTKKRALRMVKVAKSLHLGSLLGDIMKRRKPCSGRIIDTFQHGRAVGLRHTQPFTTSKKKCD